MRLILLWSGRHLFPSLSLKREGESLPHATFQRPWYCLMYYVVSTYPPYLRTSCSYYLCRRARACGDGRCDGNSLYFSISHAYDAIPMATNLTQAQVSLLAKLKTDYHKGLPFASSFNRGDDNNEDLSSFQSSNTVSPPINCPKWVCCLLPCIQHIPKMKLFRSIQPEDAEVRRDGEWVVYDASSLVQGDIVRLRPSDRVPADCVLLSLEQTAENKAILEMVIDESQVNGQKTPKTITNAQLTDNTSGNLITLYYGSQILHGTGIAVVTSVGSQTLLAKLIQRGAWPPSATLGPFSAEEDEEVGLSLINRSS